MFSRFIVPSIAACAAVVATASLVNSDKAMAQNAAATPAIKGDAATGAKLFVQCRACHTVNVGGRDGVGPNLAGVMGKNAASRASYNYSNALKNSKIRWDKQSMDNFLKRPSAAVPGTKMGFGGMPNAKARADMVAYLETLRAR